MTTITLDLAPEEILIMAVLLNRFVDEENEALRNSAGWAPTAADKLRCRVEIATKLRGKLPLIIQDSDDE